MAGNSRSIVRMAAVFTYSPSTLIVDRHGNHSAAASWQCNEKLLLLKKSHAVHSDTLSPKAAASLRHDGVSSVRTRSADAGKTIVVLFVVVCAPARLHTAYFCLCFLGLLHTSGISLHRRCIVQSCVFMKG